MRYYTLSRTNKKQITMYTCISVVGRRYNGVAKLTHSFEQFADVALICGSKYVFPSFYIMCKVADCTCKYIDKRYLFS